MGGGGGGDGSPKRNVFPGKNFADPTIKRSKIFFLPNLKNKDPSLAKKFTKGYHSVCHTCPLPVL